MRTEWIPLTACTDHGLYKIDSKNFKIGIFDSETNGFIGIKRKFGSAFLDTEYHYDYVDGEAQPYQLLEKCSIKFEDNVGIFKYIEDKEREYKTK